MQRQSPIYEQISYHNSQHAHIELSQKDSSYVPMHWHDALELIRILDGTLDVYIGNDFFHLTAGQVIIINPNELHSTISVSGNSSILLQVPTTDLWHFAPALKGRPIAWNPYTTDPVMLEKMSGICKLLGEHISYESASSPCRMFHVESLLLEIIYRILDNFIPAFSPAESERSLPDLERLSVIFKFTEDHYAEPISLADAAESLHLQVNYFCRFFKKNTGQTYLEYLQDYRLAKIYQELGNRNISINDLAQKHGFTNLKLFRKYFRQKFGVNPGELRS